METVKKFIKEHPHMWWGLYLPVYLTMFFIIEHLITDNYWATQTAIDDYIPFCEWFIFPYDAWAFLLVAIGLYLIVKDGEGFRRYMWTIMITFTTATVFCALVPNGQDLRPAVMEHHNIAAWLLCGDDALLNGLDLPFETLRCGRSEHCNVRVTDIVRRGIDGLDCTVTTPRRSYRLSIPSPGDYMIYSTSMAVAIGEYLGLSEQEIVEGVVGYVSTGSRMRRIRLPEDRLIIDDCYNANPQAMEAALEILADTACRRRVAVLGDMGELGPISRDAHLQVGRTTARLGLDAVIAIGPKAAAIAQTAGPRAQHFAAIEEALPALRREFTPGTAVLVKASHAMEFGKIVIELEKM